MKGRCIRAVLVIFPLSGVNAFGQGSINATLSGTVSDTSGEVIAGVEVVAANTATGVVTTARTNETGT